MRNAGLEEKQAGMKIAGRNINNFRHADNTTLIAESEEELESLLKEESEKVGLKLNVQKTKIMLVPGVRRVYSLLVAAGLQQHADGIQLQEHLTGHRVKEGDVGKGRRGQQEDFPRRGLLAQF